MVLFSAVVSIEEDHRREVLGQLAIWDTNLIRQTTPFMIDFEQMTSALKGACTTVSGVSLESRLVVKGVFTLSPLAL